jgi:hypothetical protein
MAAFINKRAMATARTADARKAYTYITEADAMPAVGATEGQDDPLVRVKLFNPAGAWTWYLIEADPETGEAFGFVDGFEPELGYIDLNELADQRLRFGLYIERDIHWTPRPLSEVTAAIAERRYGKPATT